MNLNRVDVYNSDGAIQIRFSDGNLDEFCTIKDALTDSGAYGTMQTLLNLAFYNYARQYIRNCKNMPVVCKLDPLYYPPTQDVDEKELRLVLIDTSSTSYILPIFFKTNDDLLAAKHALEDFILASCRLILDI